MFEIMDFWVWAWLNGLHAQKYELKPASVIVMIFGINHRFVMLDDLFF